MLTTDQITRLLPVKFQPIVESQKQRFDRLKKEAEMVILEEFPGGATIHTICQTVSLSKCVVRELLNTLHDQGKVYKKKHKQGLKNFVLYVPK